MHAYLAGDSADDDATEAVRSLAASFNEHALGKRAAHAERAVRVTFVPHLAPFPRGIFATVVAPLLGTVLNGQVARTGAV